MKLHLLSIFCFFASFELQSQSVSGFVTDSLTGEKLVGCSIFDINKQISTNTNNQGYYSLNIKDY